MSVANLEGCGRVAALSASLLLFDAARDVDDDAAGAARARFAVAAARRAEQASARRLRVEILMATKTRVNALGES